MKSKNVTRKELWAALTHMEAEFLREWLIDGNNGRAARAAGFSEKSADSQASQLLKKPKIKRVLVYEQARTMAKFDIRREDIVRALSAVAFGHLGMIADWDDRGNMTLIPRDELDDQALKFLDSIEQINLGPGMSKLTVKTAASQRLKALELLGKLIGLWDDGNRTDSRDRSAVIERLSEYFRRKKEQGGASGAD
jgi:phage terminase small subunit